MNKVQLVILVIIMLTVQVFSNKYNALQGSNFTSMPSGTMVYELNSTTIVFVCNSTDEIQGTDILSYQRELVEDSGVLQLYYQFGYRFVIYRSLNKVLPKEAIKRGQ